VSRNKVGEPAILPAKRKKDVDPASGNMGFKEQLPVIESAIRGRKNRTLLVSFLHWGGGGGGGGGGFLGCVVWEGVGVVVGVVVGGVFGWVGGFVGGGLFCGGFFGGERQAGLR